MKQTLENYIRQDEEFRQVLSKQKGGIMKYWAEHPDSDGLEALRKGYRDLCAHVFREANKWSMTEISLKNGALAEGHIKNELVYMEALKPDLSMFPEVAEKVLSFIDSYMDYAFREFQKTLYPDGIPPLVFYDQVITSYNLDFGKAGACLWLVLKEHRGTAKAEKDEYDLWLEFEIRQYARIYYYGVKKLRQAIKEMIDKNTQGKAPIECRRICRELAIETMKRLDCFVKRVNGDYDRVIIYKDKEKKYPVIWSTNDLAQILNVDESRIKRDNIEITKEEMEWLRVGMNYRDTSDEATDSKGMTPLQECFRRYYRVLIDLGHFWAAQLLRHGIDMQELEKNKNIILIHQYYRLGDFYYVDRLPDDHRGDCCVYDNSEARRLLAKIKHKIPICKELTWEDEKQCFKDAVLSVMERKKTDGDYLFKKNRQWIAVYRFAIDIGIMYDVDDPESPEDSSTPQYATFGKFAQELQLDVNPPTRLPFTKNDIKDIKKKLYSLYNKPYPWSKDELEGRRAVALYKELEDVYIALEEEYYNLVWEAEKSHE